MMRTIEQALDHAEKLRVEIPQLIQPEVSAHDIVVLADEVLRLRDKLALLDRGIQTALFGKSKPASA